MENYSGYNIHFQQFKVARKFGIEAKTIFHENDNFFVDKALSLKEHLARAAYWNVKNIGRGE